MKLSVNIVYGGPSLPIKIIIITKIKKIEKNKIKNENKKIEKLKK